jgi:hypothetical protein
LFCPYRDRHKRRSLDTPSGTRSTVCPWPPNFRLRAVSLADGSERVAFSRPRQVRRMAGTELVV